MEKINKFNSVLDDIIDEYGWMPEELYDFNRPRHETNEDVIKYKKILLESINTNLLLESDDEFFKTIKDRLDEL